jgi:hypothetical protein
MTTEIPTSSDAIDVQWLDEMLSDPVRGGATIVSVSREIIGEGVGFLGDVARLSLTHDALSPTSTRSLISKISHQCQLVISLNLAPTAKPSEHLLLVPHCTHDGGTTYGLKSFPSGSTRQAARIPKF